ncbi:MAG: extracellular solute-binding protein [Clostridia bacterium]
MKSMLAKYGVLLLTIVLVLGTCVPAHAQEVTEIEFWDVNTRAPHVETFEKIAADFQAETGIAVRRSVFSTSDLMTQVTAAKASGALPDLILADYGGSQDLSMGMMGVAAPVNDIVDKVGRDYWISDMYLDHSSLDGQCYAIPWITFPHILVYRKDWFDEKGLKAPTTWEVWYEAAKALTEDTDQDGRIDRYGVIFGFKEGFPYQDLLASNGDYYWDAEGNVTVGERTAETIDFFRKMADDCMYPGSVSYTHEDTRLAFTQGTGAMIATSTSYLFPFERDVPAWFDEGKVAATAIPVNAPGREGTAIAYNSLVVVNGPKQEAAKCFVEYLMREDVAVRYFSGNVAGHIPVFACVYENEAFWTAREKFRSTYESALVSIRESRYDEPVVPWSGVFNSIAGRDKLMENVYVNRWTTEQTITWLKDTVASVRDEWKD